MITQEDIDRFNDMQESVPKQLLIIDTMQFFEIEIPADVDAESFVDSEICRQICADEVLSGTTDLKLKTIKKEEKESE